MEDIIDWCISLMSVGNIFIVDLSVKKVLWINIYIQNTLEMYLETLMYKTNVKSIKTVIYSLLSWGKKTNLSGVRSLIQLKLTCLSGEKTM